MVNIDMYITWFIHTRERISEIEDEDDELDSRMIESAFK